MPNSPTPYHLVAHHRGKLRAAGELFFVLFMIVFGLGSVSLAMHGLSRDGAGGLLRLCVPIALLPLVAWLGANATKRDPRMLSSVDGKLRWRLLARAAALALAVKAAAILAMVGVVAATEGWSTLANLPWVSAGELLPLALVICAVVPLQAAGEEYVFRGTLLQSLGAFVRRPWFGIAISSLLFVLLHGVSGQAFVAIGGFAVIAAWLTIRTGGLESAIALHAASNVSVFMMAAASGGAGTWITDMNTDISWLATAFHVAGDLVFAALVVRMPFARTASVSVATAPAPGVAGHSTVTG